MLRQFHLAILLATVMLIGGCRDVPVASIHGVATTELAVTFDAIVGSWVVVPEPPAEGEEAREERRPTFIDVARGDSGYTMTIRRGVRRESFDATLIEIGGLRYFDAQRRDTRGNEEKDGYEAPHHFFRLKKLDGPAFEINFLSQEWLLSEHEAGRLALPHTVASEVIVLTATPEQLRAFIDGSFETPEAWAPLGARIVPMTTQ